MYALHLQRGTKADTQTLSHSAPSIPPPKFSQHHTPSPSRAYCRTTSQTPRLTTRPPRQRPPHNEATHPPLQRPGSIVDTPASGGCPAALFREATPVRFRARPIGRSYAFFWDRRRSPRRVGSFSLFPETPQHVEELNCRRHRTHPRIRSISPNGNVFIIHDVHRDLW
jgi:hypothetical protein